MKLNCTYALLQTQALTEVEGVLHRGKTKKRGTGVFLNKTPNFPFS